MIYLTGATGFIGSRVAQRLLARGERIRILVRSRSKGAPLEKLGAELIEGELADQAVHERGMAGATSAIHLAATYEVGVVDRAAMWRTNVEGTRAFLGALASSGIPRAIHVSTTVALGPSSHHSEPREAYSGPYHSVYHETKAAAHGLARAAQQNGMPLIIVCPSFVYGPGDAGPAGNFIRDLLGGKLPALLSRPAHFSYVYVEDVVSGIVSALDRGKVGEVYILSGQAAHMNEFAERVAKLGGVRAPVLRFPVPVAKGTGVLLDFVSRLTKLRFPITREGVTTTASDRWLHGHERATRELGYVARSLDDGLAETIR